MVIIHTNRWTVKIDGEIKTRENVRKKIIGAYLVRSVETPLHAHDGRRREERKKKKRHAFNFSFLPLSAATLSRDFVSNSFNGHRAKQKS